MGPRCRLKGPKASGYKVTKSGTYFPRDFWRGALAVSPFVLVFVPVGLLFGALASEAGFDTAQVVAAAFLVIAGAAQFTAVALYAENAPTIVIILTSVAVNLRMAMYSAALVPHLGQARFARRALYSYFILDQTFAAADVEFTQNPTMTLAQKSAYFTGAAVFLAPLWYFCCYLGAILGAAIPPEFSIDFALPICFIALSVPSLRSLPHFIAAGVAVICSLVFISVPYSLGLILAAFVAMIAAVQTELALERRAR